MIHTTDIELEIYKFVVDNFMFGQADGLGYDESLLEKGVIDSTGVLELVTFLQENFMITVEDDEIVPANLETIHGIITFVDHKLNVRSLTGREGKRLERHSERSEESLRR